MKTVRSLLNMPVDLLAQLVKVLSSILPIDFLFFFCLFSFPPKGGGEAKKKRKKWGQGKRKQEVKKGEEKVPECGFEPMVSHSVNTLGSHFNGDLGHTDVQSCSVTANK